MLMHPSNRVETLEARKLLSAAFVFHGVLEVIGSPTQSNTISVKYTDSGKLTIEAIVNYTTRKGAAKNLDDTFPAAGINSVLIRGGNSADNIAVGQTVDGFDKPTRIDALGGADTVTGADENTIVNAGNGSDTVTLGNGNDIVRGGLGADLLTVGNGTDKVDGGLGNDTIVTGSGPDTVNGGFGNDLITTHDVTGGVLVHGGAGNDSITSGDGNDSIWGGQGNDSIVAGNGNDTFGCILGSNTVVAGTGHNIYEGRKSQAFFEAHNTTSYDPSKDTLVIRPSESAPPVV